MGAVADWRRVRRLGRYLRRDRRRLLATLLLLLPGDPRPDTDSNDAPALMMLLLSFLLGSPGHVTLALMVCPHYDCSVEFAAWRICHILMRSRPQLRHSSGSQGSHCDYCDDGVSF